MCIKCVASGVRASMMNYVSGTRMCAKYNHQRMETSDLIFRLWLHQTMQ